MSTKPQDDGLWKLNVIKDATEKVRSFLIPYGDFPDYKIECQEVYGNSYYFRVKHPDDRWYRNVYYFRYSHKTGKLHFLLAQTIHT